MGNLRTTQIPENCDVQLGKSWIYDGQGFDTAIFRRVYADEPAVFARARIARPKGDFTGIGRIFLSMEAPGTIR